MKNHFPLTIFFALALTACAGTLTPEKHAASVTPEPASATVWQALSELRNDDWFYLLNRGALAYDWRLRAIDTAVDSIDLQTFIWDLDDVGHEMRDHLLQAAARGVFVRVLVDDSFILNADAELLAIDEHDNIELRIYNPYQRRSSLVSLRTLLNLGEFHRLDHRMHNKVMVVDNQVAILGGRNLDEKYFGFHEQYNFRDFELVVGGDNVRTLAGAFDLYWNNRWSMPIQELVEQRSGHDGVRPAGAVVKSDVARAHLEETESERLLQWRELVTNAHEGSATLLLDAPPQDRPDQRSDAPVQVSEAILSALDTAEEDIWLISAYLIPTAELESAIERAIKRGVRVRILTNSIGSTNHLSAHAAWRRHTRKLVAIGADVHELREDASDRNLYIASPVAEKTLSLHAKLLVLDRDRVFVGSANLDPRSLRINTEVGYLIDSPGLNAAMRSALEPDFAPQNAWHLQLDDAGELVWVSGAEVMEHQPTQSHMARIEDWFMSLLPIEDEL